MNIIPQENTAHPQDAQDAGPRNNRRQGKASKSRNNDKFRARKNKEFDTENRKQISQRLGLLDTDESRRLKEIVETIKLTQQPQAIPLSITTRSVGFTTALFYDRAVTTWNLQALESISTIHQVYRVALWAAHFKVWHAQQIQTEPISDGNALQHFTIHDDFRQAMNLVGVLPTVLALVLNSIGRIETQAGLYHSGYSRVPAVEVDLLDYRTMVVTPENIRVTLDMLADVGTPVATIEYYRQHNSIPGLQFENGFLINADAVYPANYTVEMLNHDIAAFNNLITRVQGRLPSHQFSHFTWHGKGDSAGLWSCELTPVHIAAIMEPIRLPPVAGLRRRRNADGAAVAVPADPPQQFRYTRSDFSDVHIGFHSLEATNDAQVVLGTSSLVGEACFISTRYETSGKVSTSSRPIQVLRGLTVAPR